MSTPKTTPRIAASQSFNLEEVDLLEFTFDTMLRGGNPQPAVVRSKVLPKLLRKIKTMKSRADAIKATRTAPVVAEAQKSCESPAVSV